MPGHDESARSAGLRGSRLDALPPGAGDFRGLVERLPLIIYIDEPDPRSPNLYISPETTAMLGYTPEDWAASPDFFVSICHPDDLERVLTETSRLLAEGGQTPIEFRLLRRDGSVAWVRDEAVVVRDEAGEPMCTQGYMLDITERKEREAAVRQADARTRAMLDAALDGVVMVDHLGAIIEFNPAAERIFGYGREAVVGRQMVDLIVPPAYRAAHSAGFQRYLATGESTVLGKRIEIRGMRADGSEFPLELSIAAVDVGGEPVFTAYVRDISDQHRREAALLESEAIVNSSFDAVVGRTIDGIVTKWNPAAERVFGYAAEEIIGRSVSLLWPPELRGELGRLNDSLRVGEVIEPFEAVRVRKDGQRIHAESTLAPIVSASGEIIGISSIARDITERKRSQALAAEQAELLEFMATGAALPLVLDRLVRFVEKHGEDVIASILLLDRDGLHLRHGAAPSLPQSYREAIDGVAIGPTVGSCGTAAYLRERVRVSDIATDPLWSDYRELALGAGLGACWSTPIFATDGGLLGTFALYYREPRDCGERDVDIVELATHLAGIAIERARSEEAARESEERYRDLFENANEPIGTVTMDEQITEVNRAFERVLGYSRAELIGTSLSQYLTPAGAEASRQATARKLSGEVSGTTFEQEFRAKDGHIVDPRGLEPRDRGGRAPGRDPGDLPRHHRRKQAEGELRRLSELNRHLSLHDSLTGLPNRASFREQVERAIGVHDRDGTELSVLLLDLDRFKEINDTLGHHYGDLLLIELARRLESVLPGSDTVARLGGDEFGILVPQPSGTAVELERTLERTLAALEQPFQVGGLPLYVEASIGVARYPAHGHDVDLLLQRADVAMYLAKDSGMPHAIYTAELDHHDTASLTLLSELPRAIQERRARAALPAEARRQDGRSWPGVEALVRWQHPTRGLIAPGDFVPAAEKTGLIQPLTRYVLDEALGQVTRWQQRGRRSPSRSTSRCATCTIRRCPTRSRASCASGSSPASA